MGWTSTHKPKGQKLTEFFIDHGTLRWSEPCAYTYTVLDSAFVNLSEYYAAVEQIEKSTGERRVWAAVFMVKLFKEDNYGHNICWKGMDESMGPNISRCPERVLKLLTPTDYEHAVEWRARCWAHIEKAKARPKIKPGMKLRYGGTEYIANRSLGARGWLVNGLGAMGDYRMSRSQVQRAEIVAGSHV